MINKRKIIAGLALTTMFLGIPSVGAYSFGVGYASTGSGNPDTTREDTVVSLPEENGIKYTCKYNYSIGSNSIITIDGYDINDKEIMKHSLNINEDDRALAGTSIGLNIYETKTISWKVTKVEVTETKKKETPIYKCTYVAATNVPITINSNYEISSDLRTLSLTSRTKTQTIALCSNKYTTSYSTCPAADSGCVVSTGPHWSYNRDDGETTYTSTNSTKIEACRSLAANDAISKANGNVYASYEIEMSDSNDINGNDSIKITNEDANKTMACQGGVCNFTYTSGMTEGSKTIKFYYRIARACINVKTAKITYKNGDDKCDKDLEREIANTTINGNTHWHYFIPLNAKSTDKIQVNMLKAPGTGGKLTTSECLYVMQHNPINASNPNSSTTTYVDLIKPIADGEEFDGDYKCHDCNPSNQDNWNSRQSADYLEVQTNGCYLTSKIKIPVVQKFYNEQKITDDDNKKTVKLSGFNFYYKPINISDSKTPFPNGLPENTTSIWKEWYEEETNKPDLTKSFDKISYIASGLDLESIRDYNSENPYTSWEKMHVNGHSNYIKNENNPEKYNGIYRNDYDGYYKLGCGPANSFEYYNGDTEKPNHLYIKGCELS